MDDGSKQQFRAVTQDRSQMAVLPSGALTAKSFAGCGEFAADHGPGAEPRRPAALRQVDTELEVLDDVPRGQGRSPHTGPWKRHSGAHQLTGQPQPLQPQWPHFVLDQPGELRDPHRSVRHPRVPASDRWPAPALPTPPLSAARIATDPGSTTQSASTMMTTSGRILLEMTHPVIERITFAAQLRALPPDCFRALIARDLLRLIRAVVRDDEHSIGRPELRRERSESPGDRSLFVMRRDQDGDSP